MYICIHCIVYNACNCVKSNFQLEIVHKIPTVPVFATDNIHANLLHTRKTVINYLIALTGKRNTQKSLEK